MRGLASCPWPSGDNRSLFLRLASDALSSSYDPCLLRAMEHVSRARSVSPSCHPKKAQIPQEPLGISALIQRPTILSHYHRRSIYTILPFTDPGSNPSILCPSNVSLSTSPHTMAASIWFSPSPPPLTLRRSVQFQTTGSNCANIVKRYLPGSRVLLQSRKEGNG